jgi:archaellum component FlaC
MLVFLVLILSLIWTFLTLNAFASRTNWANQAKKFQAEAQVAADAATKMKALRDSEAEANEDAKRAIAQERDRYREQVAQLQDQLSKLSSLYNTAFTEEQKKSAKAAELQANIDKLNGQVAQLTNDVKRLEGERNNAVIAMGVAKGERENAEIQRDNYKKASEKFADEVQKLREDNNDLRTGKGTGIPGVRTPVAPVGLRGTITKVDEDRGTIYLEMTPGLDAGIQKGMTLDVQRLVPAGRYVGKVTITIVTNKGAAGTFTPATPGAPVTGEAKPRAGDEIVASK